MKLNTLRIEPHIVEGYSGRLVLWRIWVDDQKITDSCLPFLANNGYVAFSHQGLDEDYFVVRGKQDYIFWMEVVIGAVYEIEVMAMMDDDSEIKVFDAITYKAEIEKAYHSSQEMNAKILYTNSEHTTMLPLTSVDFTALLERQFPKDFRETSIYREPKTSSDTTGIILFRRMEIAINSLTEVEICDPPEKQIELRIGLDETEFTEAIWHIGKVNDQFAVYFEHLPSFPVWLQSPEFDKVLSQETFVKGL